jgi:hypothetical protein
MALLAGFAFLYRLIASIPVASEDLLARFSVTEVVAGICEVFLEWGMS